MENPLQPSLAHQRNHFFLVQAGLGLSLRCDANGASGVLKCFGYILEKRFNRIAEPSGLLAIELFGELPS